MTSVTYKVDTAFEGKFLISWVARMIFFDFCEMLVRNCAFHLMLKVTTLLAQRPVDNEDNIGLKKAMLSPNEVHLRVGTKHQFRATWIRAYFMRFQTFRHFFFSFPFL
jgi:hypothetical protein